MIKLFLVFLLYCIGSVCPAQVISESFSDSDLTDAPAWTGDLSDFRINSSGQLQLNKTISDTSVISTPFTIEREMEWRFFIRLNFSPSASNYCIVHLFSDEAGLKIAHTGYFLKFGEAGSNDAIELFYRQGSTMTSIARTANSTIANAFALNVKVTRDSTNVWKVFTGSGQTYSLAAEGTHAASISQGHFGFYCQYTSSNAAKFYFDDIYAGPVIEDNTPPQVQAFSVKNETTMQVSFSEIPDLTAITSGTFKVQPGNLDATYSQLSDQKIFNLVLQDSLRPGNQYALEINDLRDAAGNRLDTTIEFTWYRAQRYDIIINEVMVDPSPSQGLPQFEYLELYNRTERAITLTNWSIRINGSPKQITNASIPPNGYLLLICPSAEPDFQLMGNRYVVNGMSTSALPNSGARILLADETGNMIDYFSYELSSYHDSYKSDGGFSLELIDPFNNCAGNKNWTATLSPEGGTPGIPNSVMNPGTSVTPAIRSACIVNDRELELRLTQYVDSSYIDQNRFLVIPGLQIISAKAGSRFSEYITIQTSGSFDPGTIYNLSMQGIRSCDGTLTSSGSVLFSTGSPAQGDIVINEIMADPEPSYGLPKLEYIELYNRTGKPLFTRGLKLCAGKYEGQLECGIIDPSEYVILCDIQHERYFSEYGKVITVDAMPALPNTGATLSVVDASGEVLSSVTYSDTWYNDDVKSAGGFSLEQADPDNYCGGEHNWLVSRSASGGTPGKINSTHSRNADHHTPYLKHVSVREPDKILVAFSEPMQRSGVQLSTFSIDNDIGSPVFVSPANPMLESYILELPVKLQEGITYHLTVTNAADCAGNNLEQQVRKIAIPVMPAERSVLMNEIMYDAHETTADYLELYNNGDKPVSLGSLILADIDQLTDTYQSERRLDTTGIILFPGEYICFTGNTNDLCAYSRCYAPSNIVNTYESLDLNLDGSLALVSTEGKIIDRLTYADDQHFYMLTSAKGISLEKISPILDSEIKSNWHSASSLSGWGTPGYKNSQDQYLNDTSLFAISPEVITPDNDGINDLLNITFAGLDPGTLANVYIFSGTGHKCRIIGESTLCGTQGLFTWDGTDDAGKICSGGIYIVYFETFDPSGRVKKQKKICVLGRGG